MGSAEYPSSDLGDGRKVGLVETVLGNDDHPDLDQLEVLRRSGGAAGCVVVKADRAIAAVVECSQSEIRWIGGSKASILADQSQVLDTCLVLLALYSTFDFG